MTESSGAAWAWWTLILVLASSAGVGVSRQLPWSSAAIRAKVDIAFGFAAAPFLAGLATAAALALVPSVSHRTHFVVVIGALALLFGLLGLKSFAFPSRKYGTQAKGHQLGGILWVGLLGIAALWVSFMLYEALLMPLTQNDSLEYATVGRVLFEARDLGAYPPIQPEMNSSGFYGPWTHPPLYPSLIYLAYLAQGHADGPGLMRTIAPWFALSMACLVYAMGRVRDALGGLLAVILLLSAPLVALGAGSGLIDALPMSGMVILIATISQLQGRSAARPIGCGIALGLALWTHSQAVLFVPLAVATILLLEGWTNRRFVGRHLAIMLGVATAIALWPYLRNLQVFGSLISDNPVVFALPELDWRGYFAKARGLESWAEKIQYGVFKGWLVVEAYGVVFWLALIGMYLVHRQRKRFGLNEFFAIGWDGESDKGPFVACAMLVGYLMGVVLSTLLGVDLMIKNERYLLVVLPPAALLGGAALAHMLRQGTWLEQQSAGFMLNLKSAGILLIVLVGSLQLVLLAVYQNGKRSRLGIPVSEMMASHEKKLRHWPSYAATQYLKMETPAEALVLGERPADLFYSSRRMISYLDPRLVDFYREKNLVKGLSKLRDLGITHIQLPGYSHPSIYNSLVQNIAGNPELTSLVFAAGAEQIYALVPSSKKLSDSWIDLAPSLQHWTQVRSLTVGGRRALTYVFSARALDGTGRSIAAFDMPLLQRNWSTFLLSGDSPDYRGSQSLDSKDFFKVDADGEYMLELELDGNAYAYFYLYQYDSKGRLIGAGRTDVSLISELALSPVQGKKQMRRRFVTDSEAAYIRVGLEHKGDTELTLYSGRLVAVVDK